MTFVAPSSEPAPAGWYRDPLGIPQLRWWNGMSWTNSIQDQRPEFPSVATPSVLVGSAA